MCFNSHFELIRLSANYFILHLLKILVNVTTQEEHLPNDKLADSGGGLFSYLPNMALFKQFITTNLASVILFRTYGYVLCSLDLHYSH